MVGVLDLWLPALVSAVLVFIASMVIHMALKYHAGDHRAAPDEDGVMDALRPFALDPGHYVIPRATSMEEMGGKEYREKIERGPALMMTVMDPAKVLRIGPQFIGWFLFAAAVSLCAGYAVGVTAGPGAAYMDVFRATGTVAFLAFGAGEVTRSIWFHQNWGRTARGLLDALIYGLVTAGVFGWLWPS